VGILINWNKVSCYSHLELVKNNKAFVMSIREQANENLNWNYWKLCNSTTISMESHWNRDLSVTGDFLATGCGMVHSAMAGYGWEPNSLIIWQGITRPCTQFSNQPFMNPYTNNSTSWPTKTSQHIFPLMCPNHKDIEGKKRTYHKCLAWLDGFLSRTAWLPALL
jgi:hypothetical protein